MKLGSALVLLLVFAPASAGASYTSLPAGYHEGRCLYVADGSQRIAGRCIYKIHKDGSFHIDGPRQIFGGSDTVDQGASALTYSRDWWADVFRDEGGWSGYGNDSIADVHGGRLWALRRQGACFVGENVKVCLWRDQTRLSRRPFR